MLLEVKDLAIKYGNNAPTVSEINLTLDEGQILAIVGESGSGKTTVIRAILGYIAGNGEICNGDIFYKGKSLLSLSTKERRKMAGTNMSMIFQDSGNMINPVRKIGVQFEDYILAHKKMSRIEANKKACKMLTKMRLANPKNIMNSYQFELSGGMRQRIGIAMAMTFKPNILLADEPTSALDVTTQAQIVKQIIDIRDEDKTAVIIVTHNLGIASYMAKDIIVMKDGKIIEAGPREQIINHPQHEYTKELLATVPIIGGKNYVD